MKPKSGCGALMVEDQTGELLCVVLIYIHLIWKDGLKRGGSRENSAFNQWNFTQETSTQNQEKKYTYRHNISNKFIKRSCCYLALFYILFFNSVMVSLN